MEANINLNDFVCVELTDYGWECIENYCRDVLGRADADISPYINALKNNTKERHTAKGKRNLTEFQLHEIMNIFGKHAYNGGKTFFKDNEIYLSFMNY